MCGWLRPNIILDRSTRGQGVWRSVFVRYRCEQYGATRWQGLEGHVQESVLAISFSPGRPGDCSFHGNFEMVKSLGVPVGKKNTIPLLAACDFLYAMYPAGGKYQLFRRTSRPLKFPPTCRHNGQSSPTPPPTARSPAWSQNIDLAPSVWLASKTISQVTFVPSSSSPYRGNILREPQAT
jgi:hypothetical protein